MRCHSAPFSADLISSTQVYCLQLPRKKIDESEKEARVALTPRAERPLLLVPAHFRTRNFVHVELGCMSAFFSTALDPMIM